MFPLILTVLNSDYMVPPPPTRIPFKGCQYQGNIPSRCPSCYLQAFGSSLDRRGSNWELRPLPTPSIEYAALDAWILLALLGHFLQQAGTELGDGHRCNPKP